VTNGSQTQWWTQDGVRTPPAEPSPAPSAPRGGPARGRAAGRARLERERQDERRRRVVVVLVVIALVLGAGYVVVSLIGSHDEAAPDVLSTAVTDYAGPGHGSVRVTVPADVDGRALGDLLVTAGVVADADVLAAAYDAADGVVAAGVYELPLEASAEAAVAALLDPASKASLKLTLAAGLTSWQILEKISEKSTIPLADLQAAAADAAAIGLPEQAGGKVEGWLAAGSYDVPADASAAQVLGQLVARTVQVLTDKGVDPAAWQSVLTKASLVEREMTLDAVRPQFARVIENRLTNQPLDVPAATAYGAGTTSAPTAEMLADADNPYNTHLRVGLPPTPIASPGEASIDAVLAPADGDWMFWLVVDAESGETQFATTYDEQVEHMEALSAAQAADEG